MTIDLLNQILMDMLDSGELELGWNRDIKEFRLGYFKLYDDYLKCDIIFMEFGKKFVKTISIRREVIDRYMIQDSRNTIINDLLDEDVD